MAAESESSDLDREVDASMRMFEKSQVGPAAAINPQTPKKVLLALDGSPQDQTGTNAANHLQGRFQTETLIIDARNDDHHDRLSDHDQSGDKDQSRHDLAADRAAEIPASRAIKRPDGDAFDAILDSIAQHDVDLLIVPCPFGRSFEHVGIDSAGTVIDVLLSRCPVPMLVNRRDDQHLAESVSEISLVIGGECDVADLAAAWVFGLAKQSTVITLNLVIEKEHYENMKVLVEALHPEERLQPEQFSEALTKTHHRLHSAMAKTAAKLGQTYQLRPVAGEVAPPNPLNESNQMLLVMPLEVDDRFGQGFVHDRIRRSPHPVLVVPSHVPQ